MEQLVDRLIADGGFLGPIVLIVGWYALRAYRRDEAAGEKTTSERDECRDALAEEREYTAILRATLIVRDIEVPPRPTKEQP